jgi:hypothetical protein
MEASQFGGDVVPHPDTLEQCPLLEVKRTFSRSVAMSAFDPKRKYRLGKFGGLFLSSSGIIRCNLIRGTAQAEHKHIPRQHNDHHSGDSEP